jgi:SAM-dependent methyltransferase
MSIMIFTEEWGRNREKMVATIESVVKARPQRLTGIHLHLGCGPHVMDGFINIDKYHVAEGVINEDMGEIPSFSEGSVSTVYSSHSLEHLPIRAARRALRRWGRILKPEGRLYLAVPDLMEICRCMLNPEVNEHLKWNWFNYTLFGYQAPGGQENATDLNAPDDPGQYHTSGFSMEYLTKELEASGLKIIESYHYDGWGTPSIWVEAEKT